VELNRGWVFGTEPPEALGRAWDAAKREVAEGKSQRVPWEALIILTLEMDGDFLMPECSRTLCGAWERGEIDLDFLVDFAAIRLKNGGFEAIAIRFADRPLRDHLYIGRYECFLAQLIRCIAQRIDEENQVSSLRGKLLELLEPVGRWICHTPYPECRSSLLHALAAMRSCDPERVRPVIHDWINSKLGKPLEFSLGLSLLDPPPGELLIASDQVRTLVASAKKPEVRGTHFRRDLERWLVSWSRENAFDKPTLRELGEIVAHWMSEGACSPGFDWLSLAAKVEESPPLRGEVRKNLRNHDGSKPESLFAFVKTTLETMDGNAARRWKASRNGFLQELVPFAPLVDKEFLDFVKKAVDPGGLNLQGLDGAAQLLSALLSQAPETLRKQHEREWVERIEQLIGAGASGRGHLGGCVGSLSEKSKRTLQDNLLRVFGSRPPELAAEAVGWMAGTLNAAPEELPDLEECLVESIASDRREVSAASLEAVLGLVATRDGFGERHHRRLRRVRLAVEARGGYRRTSRFAEQLASLPGG